MATTASAEPLPVEAGFPPVEAGSMPLEVLLAEVKLLPAEVKEEWYWIERAKAYLRPPMLLCGFSNIYQLFYLDNGLLTLSEATEFASQFQLLTHASDRRTLELTQTLLTSTIDLQYHLIVHRLFSIEREWFLYHAKRPRNYRWANKAWAEKIKAAETESERMEIWTPMLEKETSAMIWWMQVFSASLNLKWIFPEVVIMEKDEQKKLLRERLQRYFTMKFILTVDVVFVKLVKPIMDGELRHDHKTVESLYNQDVSFSLPKWELGMLC
jgi:hypothetical protein